MRPWCDTAKSPAERTGLLLSALTLDEKLSLMGGDDPFGVVSGTPATGTSDGVDRVGVPTIYYSDGPVGPREGQATAMPSPLALGSSFDPGLAGEVGAVIGDEVKKKGNDVVHAPTVDVMRTPLAGRVFETYGEDPLLSSRLAVGWIKAAQAQGVIANIKHFAPNSQEGQVGAPPIFSLVGNRSTVNAEVDDRTLHEIYFPPFEAAVKQADVGSVMCAYNLINGQPACQSEQLLQDALRKEWGFDGYVLSDYIAATKSTAASVNNGLALDMPVGVFYDRSALLAALATGQISQAAVDARVGDILRTLFRFGAFDRDAFPADDALIDKPAHAAVARKVTERGSVLLENHGVLPLDAGKLKTIAVVGPEAETYKGGGGSSAVKPFSLTSARKAITDRAGSGVSVRYAKGDDTAAAVSAARRADVAIVFAADATTEGTDKPCLALSCTAPDPQGGNPSGSAGRPDPDALIAAVSAANPNTVVVLETGGPVLSPWAGKVQAVLESWYPGQEGGPAIAALLFGDADPGGRLPVTFPKAEGDIPTAGNALQYPGVAERTVFSEGVFTGYRHYDQRGIDPRWPFGHGLSYTDFEYSDLVVRPDGGVRVTVKNVGAREGSDVAQLYVGMPDGPVPQPPRWLRGFERVELGPGASRRVGFQLDERSLSYWNTAGKGWKVAPGCYSVEVGRSSRDIKARAFLSRGGAACPRPCAAAAGRVRGARLAAVSLGAGREGVRDAFPSFETRGVGTDVFCLSDGGQVRVGYAKERARIAATTSRRIGAGRLRVGLAARKLRGRAKSIGKAGSSGTWFVRRRGKATQLFRVRGRRIRELGIAPRRVTRSRRGARRLIRTLGR